MIKKIIACLTICFIITGIISPVFSDASALPQPNWSDPGISEIINISDLTGWMLNGGTYDVSTYTDAESFMNDYFNARTKTRLVSPGEASQDYYEVLPGFGINNQLVAGESFARPLETNRVIASSFRDHTGYGRRFSNEVNNALLSSGSLYDTKIPLLNEVEFANFVGYNHDALRLYSEFFNNEPEPGPTPPAEYSEFINKINGSGFWWKDITNYNMFNNSGSVVFNPKSYTWYCDTKIENDTSPYHQFFMEPLSCYIVTNQNGTYTYTMQGTRTSIYREFIQNGQLVHYWIYDMGIYLANDVPTARPWLTQSNKYTSTFYKSETKFTLSDIFNALIGKAYNINIYFDGEPWSIVFNNSDPTITPEFPDAVGGAELPNTTWPVFRPRAPYYTSVPGVLQAIEDAIADDGELDIDDLKPYLTDENGDPVPDPIFDPEPVPIPVPDPVNPDVVPGLPVLPAIPPDMPGFNGVSVLAEIINFTNQSLPTSLIVTFWGIIFGIVILGLIKILHK